MLKADNLIGQVIGGYLISFKLPSQSAPSLYLGESKIEPGRQVIFKLFSSHPLSSLVDQESFLQEARMFQHLKHPHIVPLLDYGLTQNLPYIVTPYTSWRPLSTYIRRRWLTPFPLPKTLLLLWQLGEALDYAHQRHLFHGQLTPHCVLLDNQQRPLLTDFRFTSLVAGATSQVGSNSGSSFYLAPEQRTGQHKKESDQYALACIAYELLTGRRPAPAVTHAEEGAVSFDAPSALNPVVPLALDQVLLKALSADPKQRFGSLRELLAALPPPPEEIRIAPDVEMIQTDAPTIGPSVAQAQPSQGLQQTLDLSPPDPEPVNDPRRRASMDAEVAHQDHSQTLLSGLPTYEQKLINQHVTPLPPPTATASSASALSATPTSFSLSERLMRPLLPRIAQLLLIAVALLIVLSSGTVLVSAFGPTRSVAAITQVKTRFTVTDQVTKTVVLSPANVTATAQKASKDVTATAQAKIIATARAQEKPQLLWTFTTGDAIWSSPTVADGVVYVGSNDATLYAIDAITARQKWAFTTGGGTILSRPTVVNGTVYIGSADFHLYAIDATTGLQKWAFSARSGISASAVVANGVVYISSGDGRLYAVDATNGLQKWAFAAGGPFWSSPVVVNGVVYVGSIDHKLYAVDATTGLQKWAFVASGYIAVAPTVANGVVYAGSLDSKVYAINATTGLQKWAFVTGNPIWSSPTVVNGVVYVGSYDHNLYAINATTGLQKWAFATGNWVWSSPTVANGVVYVGSYDHKLYAIDATTGLQKWAFATGDAIEYSSPMVVNDVVYVGSNDHKLYSIAIG